MEKRPNNPWLFSWTFGKIGSFAFARLLWPLAHARLTQNFLQIATRHTRFEDHLLNIKFLRISIYALFSGSIDFFSVFPSLATPWKRPLRNKYWLLAMPSVLGPKKCGVYRCVDAMDWNCSWPGFSSLLHPCFQLEFGTRQQCKAFSKILGDAEQLGHEKYHSWGRIYKVSQYSPLRDILLIHPNTIYILFNILFESTICLSQLSLQFWCYSRAQSWRSSIKGIHAIKITWVLPTFMLLLLHS